MSGTDFGDEREEIIADFIVETDELIERLDQELVQLEERPDDLALLNSIFRAAHTIKGTSSFLGFPRMTELTHKAENVLDKLRNNAFKVTSEIMDCLLKALDGIRTLLDEIKEGHGADGTYDATEIQTKLIAIVENGGTLEPQAGGGGKTAVVAAVPSASTAPSSGGSSLDDILASAPKVTPKPTVEGKGKESSGGGSLDDILASAPKISPKPTVEGKGKEASGGGSLDDILASAPKISPKPTVEGRGKESSGGGASLDDILASAPKISPKIVADPKAAAAPAPDPAAKPVVAAAAPAASAPAAAAPSSGEAKAVAVEQTIRVDVERLDALMNLAGELVLSRNRLVNITRDLEGAGHDSEPLMELANVVQSISLVAGNLQMAVMKTRMLPIGKVFNKFPRMVRDLAREKKKNVDLVIIGADTEVDKSVVEAIGDPLVHLIRNSVDHGIEMPEVRAQRGKPENGTVQLIAMHQGNHVVIVIKDDGNGMDPKRIKEVAIKRGVLDETQASRMTDKEVRLLIFKPGFSTAEKVTSTSGRGVGMDVVKTNVEQLGGTIDIDSEVTVGTVMTIKLPLTLAIIQALMVKANNETYAISLANVMETVRVPRSKIQSVEGHEVVHLRDRVIPVVHLASLLDSPTFRGEDSDDGPADKSSLYIVVLGLGEQRIGLVVERLLGQEEVVIKSLGDYLQSIPGIAGSTILGDGRVSLIIDVAGLMEMVYAGKVSTRV